MNIEEGAEFARHIAGRHRTMQRFELSLHLVDSEVETLDLGGYLLGGDRVVRDLERRVRDELRAADCNAARDADAVEREADH